MNHKIRRRLAATLGLALVALALTPGIANVASLPRTMAVSQGGAVDLPLAALVRASASGAELDDSGAGLRLRAGGAGEARLTYSLMGVLPVKTVDVSVAPRRVLIPGGQSVGIAIDTAGLVVVGASDLGGTPSPARLAGLRAGDIIMKVDGEGIDGAEALSEKVSGGVPVTLDVLRDGKSVQCRVAPALDSRDAQWRLGVWVRDSTAGVGTLTFADPETGLYGALGHAITDVDTSVTMPVGLGELYRNNVVDITPSAQGRPGEITGDFIFGAGSIGTVTRNTDRGVFGYADRPIMNAVYPDGLPVARGAEIHEGPAKLLTTVDGSGVGEYDCEIARVKDRAEGARSLVVRVTDRRLIEKTGGIVQGMSGSPIIQDGRIIGAVTHVMVNDPAMGYGISIESMLESATAA